MKALYLQNGADLDALCSIFGLSKLYKDAKLLKPSSLSKKASRLFPFVEKSFDIVSDLKEVDLLICADIGSTELLPKDIKFKDFIIYDHHINLKDNKKAIYKPYGSATTLVVELLKENKIDISSFDASVLLCGIYDDTTFFTNLSTTQKDLEIASYLFSFGPDLSFVKDIVLESFTGKSIEEIENLLKSLEIIYVKDKKIGLAILKTEDYEPFIEELSFVKEFKELSAYFVIVESESKTYLFGRSNSDFDVNEVISKLGGGGHKSASALRLYNVDAKTLKEFLISILEEKAFPITLKEIMSRNPFFLYEHETVLEALDKLTKTKFSKAPILDENKKPICLITKKDLIKLSKLYPNEPVKNFCHRDITVLKEDDFVWRAKYIFERESPSLILVVNDESLLTGVLSKTDLISYLKSFTYLKPHFKHIKIPSYLEEIALLIRDISKSLGLRSYFVGGVVRDILLKRENLDIDIVVEEKSAVLLANELSKALGIKAHIFEEFQTAHLKYKDIKIELASARREHYESPGDYPKLELSSLKEDLFRRDFTINAMAISLNEEDFGSLIDFFNGLNDLNSKTIRVLHPLSFIEDPLRVLRALRFSAKLSFSLSKGTKELLEDAIKRDLLKKIPIGRVLNEIRLMILEKDFEKVLELYYEYKIFEKTVDLKPANINLLKERFERVKAFLDWYRLTFSEIDFNLNWVLFFGIFLESFKDNKEKIESFLKQIGAPLFIQKAFNNLEIYKEITKDLESKVKPSFLYDRLKRLSIYELFIILLISNKDISKKIAFYLTKLKPIKVENIPKELKGKELGDYIEYQKKIMMDNLYSII